VSPCKWYKSTELFDVLQITVVELAAETHVTDSST